MEKWSSQCDQIWTANGANKRLVLHVPIRCGSLSITTSVSLLAMELDVRSELHSHAGELGSCQSNLCNS